MSDQRQPTGPGGTVPKPGKKEELSLDPARADYRDGRGFLSRGEYTQAAMAFHNALKGFEEQGDEQGVANAADRLGDVCMAREDFRAALEHFERAYVICEKEHDIFSTLALNNKKAEAYRKLGEPDKAMEVLFAILDHYAETRNPRGTVETLEIIAEVYLELDEKQKAADALRTISSIHKNFKHARLAEEFAQRARQVEQGQE